MSVAFHVSHVLQVAVALLDIIHFMVQKCPLLRSSIFCMLLSALALGGDVVYGGKSLTVVSHAGLRTQAMRFNRSTEYLMIEDALVWTEK